MIYSGITLSNPFAKQDWRNVKSWAKLISKHKGVEAEIYRDNRMLIDMSLQITARQDHAGAELCFGVWKYSVSVKFYDTRHWDTEKNCWQVYG